MQGFVIQTKADIEGITTDQCYSQGHGPAVFDIPAEAAWRRHALAELYPEAEWQLARPPESVRDLATSILRRCPRLVSPLICRSLGYATPKCAANIIADAHGRRENSCEWIFSCFHRDPLPAVQQAIRSRHRHTGFMADYQQARALVEEVRQGGEGPLLASWF